jgi:iron complex outermembrane receptor protein
MKLFLVLILLITNASAQDSTDLYDLTLSELASIEIAAKHELSVYSSPSAVSVISRQQLKNLGINNLQHLLNYIPGFQTTRDVEQGTANRIIARGRSTALSESVLIQIDGNKINDLYTGGISIINRMLDLGNIARIEIIRGPGSALYGGNAFLGVINIITATSHNQVTLTSNSNGSIASQVMFTNQNKNLNLYLSAFNDSGDEHQFTDLFGVNSKTSDPMKGHDLYVKYNLEHWRFFARHMQRQLDDFLPLGTIGDNISQENTQQWSLTALYENNINDKLSFDVKAHYSSDTWDSTVLLIPKGIEIAPEFSLTDDFVGGPFLKSKSIKLDSNINYQYSSSQDWSFGFSFEQAEITDVYTVTTHNLTTLEPYNNFTKLAGEDSFNILGEREISSFYFQSQSYLSKEWELTSGIRYDNYSDFGESFNPRIALIWKPDQKSSLKFLYGSAFRAPNFLELHDKNNYVDYGNMELSAEEVQTYEVVWLTTADNWHWEFTYFKNDFDHLIALGPPLLHEENPFFAPQFINQNNKNSQGFETELRVKINSQFTFLSNYTWFSDDSDINVSHSSATLVINYHYQNWNINANGYYRGHNKEVHLQDSYWVAGVNIRYQYSPQLTLTLKSDNSFDKKYNTTSILYPDGVPNRGHVLSFALEYLF